MATYCITAANHQNPNNHCVSSFLVWQLDEKSNGWSKLGGRPLSFVSELVANKHTVLTGKYNASANTISLGAPVESELRIAKNETQYKISEMPTF